MRLRRLTLTVIVLSLTAATLGAQDVPAPAPAPIAPPGARPVTRGPIVPLEIQIVLARYQGEKRVSSMPYLLAVNANGAPAQLNMGADVAVPSTAFTSNDTTKPSPILSYNYRSIGTSIVSGATTTPDEGRFEVNISVDDSSVFVKDEAAVPSTGINSLPAFRSFKSRNTLLLRDGQTRQYTAATDRVSGETIRIDVTLKVVK